MTIDDDSVAPPATSATVPAWRNALGWVGWLVTPLVLALLLKAFVAETYVIPTGSMVPTVKIGDRVLVSKLAYRFGEVERGDVVVIDAPAVVRQKHIKHLLKRVIALPGDTIKGVDGAVYVNAKPLDEPYVDANGGEGRDFDELTLPEGQMWVMGDNRDESEDSRYFGAVPVDSVIGQAEFVIWPVGELGGL